MIISIETSTSELSLTLLDENVIKHVSVCLEMNYLKLLCQQLRNYKVFDIL